MQSAQAGERASREDRPEGLERAWAQVLHAHCQGSGPSSLSSAEIPTLSCREVEFDPFPLPHGHPPSENVPHKSRRAGQTKVSAN